MNRNIFHKTIKNYQNTLLLEDLLFLNDKWNVTFNKKNTDTLIEHTKIKPQKTLEIKVNQQMETFSFNPPMNLVAEDKWLIAVTSFEATVSLFNITNEKNSFSITIPGQWETKSVEKTIEELNKLLELMSQKGIELLVREVWKKQFI